MADRRDSEATVLPKLNIVQGAEEDNYFSYPYADRNPTRDGVGASDFKTALDSGVLGIGELIGSGLRAVGESRISDDDKALLATEYLGRAFQTLFGGMSEQNERDFSPAAARQIQATITDPNFWSLSAISLKATRMAPELVASVVPAVLMPGAVSAAAMVAATGGTLSATSVIDELYAKTDALSDEELQEQVPAYRERREAGMDEETARREYNAELRGLKPLLTGVVGAVTNVVGPAGMAARSLKGGASSVTGEASEGMVRATGKGMREGAGSELVEGGTEAAAIEQGSVDMGLQEGINWGTVAEQAGEGAVLGGLFGGALGAAGGRSQTDPLIAEALNTTPPTPAPSIPASNTTAPNQPSAPVQPTPGPDMTPAAGSVQQVAPSGPDATQAAALEASNVSAPPTRQAPQPELPQVDQGVAPTDVAQPIVQQAPQPAPEAAQPEPQQVGPVTTVGNTPQIGQAAPPAASGPSPVSAAPLTPEARPVAPVAQPEPAQTGPRILEDKTGTDYTRQWRDKVANVFVDPNALQTEAEPVGTNWTRDAKEQRTKTIERSKELFGKYKPREEENGIFSKKPTEQAIARNLIIERAKTINSEVEAEGIVVPKALRDTTDKSMEYPAETIVLMEARKIANAKNPTLKQLQRFKEQEVNVVLGRKEAAQSRRTEGDAAMKRGVKDNNAEVEERVVAKASEALRDEDTPEAIVMRMQEDAARMKEEAERQAQDAAVKLRTDEAVEAALAAAKKRPAAPKIVERVKRRKVDAAKKAAPVTPKGNDAPAKKPTISDAAAAKVAAVRAKQAAARAEAKKAPQPRKSFDKIEIDRDTHPAVKNLNEVREWANKLSDADYEYLQNKTDGSSEYRFPHMVGTMSPSKANVDKVMDYWKEVLSERNPPESKRPDVAQRIEKARAETNPNPTPAQAEAGNYKKGSVSINGMVVRIETPKGADRTGTDPNGREWSVKMRNDYGYIEGTKGADGEAIDVFLGDSHDASYVYVVDQVDLRTRQFDEHKVLMGFKNEEAAWNAYMKAFSDGRALDRIGDSGLRKMSIAEFKEWIKKPQTDRAGATDADIAEAREFMIAEDIDQFFGTGPAVQERVVTDPITGESAEVVTTQKASDIIGHLSTGSLTGVERVMAGVTMRALREHVGDAEVHFVGFSDIVRLSGYKGRGMPNGYYSYRGDKNIVVVRADLLANPEKLRHVVLHELVHAATVHAIKADPNIEEMISGMMYRTKLYLEENPHLEQEHYAFLNEREFVAEAMSNPEFQRILADIHLPQVAATGYRSLGPSSTMWQAFLLMVRRALGLPANTMTMLEAAIRVTGDAMVSQRYKPDTAEASFLIDGNLKPLTNAVTSRVTSMLARPELQASSSRPWLYRLRTMDSLARGADRLFGGSQNNPFRKLAMLMEERRVLAGKHYDEASPIMRRTHELQTRYEKMRGQDGKSVWDNYAELTLDETRMGVYADRPLSDQNHISKNSARDAWQRQQYPQLARRYAALPEELKAHRLELLEHFKQQQSRLAYGLIRNRLVHLFDTPDPDGLAKRIHENTLTDADKALMGDSYDVIKAAGILSKIDGPYFPLMRRGNWVVVARSGVEVPPEGTRIDTGEIEFTSKDAAEKFMVKQEGRPTLTTVYVDKTNGSVWGEEDGSRVRITAEDMNAEPRYRVAVQEKTVEMFDNRTEARARAAELAEAGMQVDDVVPRSFDLYGAQAEALSPQIQRMVSNLERRADARNFTAEQKYEMMTAVSELSMQMMAATRIQSRSIPRKNVAGASKDITRNLHDYSLAMGNHLAKLETAPKVDAQTNALKTYIDEHRNDGMNGARQELYNEVMRRITMRDPRTEGGSGPVVNRILAVSFIDKLASPSYSVINATQPMMITAPYLASRFGIGSAYSAMGKAYSDIGSLATIRQGLEATAAKVRNGQAVPTDPVNLIIGRLKNLKERAVLEFMIQKGALDTDAGLEVSTIMRERKGLVGKLDGGIGYLEGISRQLPKAVEAINRSVSALAAYRLEMARSGDHDMAVQFAYDTVNRTQFNYSHTNAAPFMNHPMLRIATQFKKYGIGMYQFLGEQAGIAINGASTPQERVQAIKALSMTIGMHVLVAGAMGLPTEPIKLVVTGANALGITDWTWADIEAGQREALAGLFGKDVGEALSRGLPRLAGVDLSSRMGIDTLMGPFGEPRSNEAQDLKAYLWDTLAGAPAGLVFDMTGGVKNLVEGDIMRGMEKLVPLKAFSDSLKAYRQMTEGTVSEKSGKQVLSPFSLGEGALRAIGFAPAREAEAYERSNMFYRSRELQEDARRDLMREYSEADSAGRGRVWRNIQKWNKDQPKDVRLSLSDLRKYKRRMEKDAKSTREGLRARKREQHLLDRADQTFNFDR